MNKPVKSKHQKLVEYARLLQFLQQLRITPLLLQDFHCLCLCPRMLASRQNPACGLSRALLRHFGVHPVLLEHLEDDGDLLHRNRSLHCHLHPSTSQSQMSSPQSSLQHPYITFVLVESLHPSAPLHLPINISFETVCALGMPRFSPSSSDYRRLPAHHTTFLQRAPMCSQENGVFPKPCTKSPRFLGNIFLNSWGTDWCSCIPASMSPTP